MAPEERKCGWSLGGWDYEAVESREEKEPSRLLTLPPPDARGRTVPWKEEAAAVTAPADAQEGQKRER